MEGKKLRDIRFEAGLNQKEFADRLGIDQSYLSKMETGARIISDKTIFKVTKEFLRRTGGLVS